jgi:hypothetical protein
LEIPIAVKDSKRTKTPVNAVYAKVLIYRQASVQEHREELLLKVAAQQPASAQLLVVAVKIYHHVAVQLNEASAQAASIISAASVVVKEAVAVAVEAHHVQLVQVLVVAVRMYTHVVAPWNEVFAQAELLISAALVVEKVPQHQPRSEHALLAQSVCQMAVVSEMAQHQMSVLDMGKLLQNQPGQAKEKLIVGILNLRNGDNVLTDVDRLKLHHAEVLAQVTQTQG